MVKENKDKLNENLNNEREMIIKELQNNKSFGFIDIIYVMLLFSIIGLILYIIIK